MTLATATFNDAQRPAADSVPPGRLSCAVQRGRVAPLRVWCLPVCVMLAAVAAGCNPGVRWQVGRYEDVHERARESGRLSFVYFRNWYSRACTEFEERVLKQPDILQALGDMVCIPLDFDWDRPLAEQWQIKVVPAYLIVAPDGALLASQEGAITKEELLERLLLAKEAHRAAGSAQLVVP